LEAVEAKPEFAISRQEHQLQELGSCICQNGTVVMTTLLMADGQNIPLVVPE